MTSIPGHQFMLILSMKDAKFLVKKHPKKLNVISVTRESKTSPEIKKNAKNHLQVDIDDISFDTASPEEQNPTSGYKFAVAEDILKVINFAKTHKVHIIHCGYGQSRSPAIAYAVYRSQGYTKDAAMDKVMDMLLKRLGPVEFCDVSPNSWIIQLTDQIFDKKK